ncbi:MAG: hypothetical protein CBC74_004910 [Crocinitomicaceae bacterium TMED114]|nr:MAG: hypothetical protein CBC74_004910 [Crocinitomicaceae bacterium TMED114]|tara:strand:+ start:57 stop:281 length:225 start_codon:yes stop_codon:yes gene_type:complete
MNLKSTVLSTGLVALCFGVSAQTIQFTDQIESAGLLGDDLSHTSWVADYDLDGDGQIGAPDLLELLAQRGSICD